ncbi:hypothetical protein ACPA9J_02435 [Pseudomonas aeruginosa]
MAVWLGALPALWSAADGDGQGHPLDQSPWRSVRVAAPAADKECVPCPDQVPMFVCSTTATAAKSARFSTTPTATNRPSPT